MQCAFQQVRDNTVAVFISHLVCVTVASACQGKVVTFGRWSLTSP